ncbi:MAG: lytic transglycosylase domain-containing protein [Acidobacteriia bacterium]|nr:lytic transglycosylase domain-containing protein [Terriglobia bacterium]
MKRKLPWGGTAAVAIFALLAAALPAPAEELLYYVKDGAIVVTNVPDHRDARPVPGFESTRRLGRGALPVTSFDPFIERVARENGLDPSLIKAVALVESGFEPKAISPKGARGIMQLMPATAKRYGVTDLHDPYQSLRAGARHLRDLLDEFGGDVTLALAAYNAGAGAVRRYGGVPAYAETRDYVARVQTKLDTAGRRRAPTPKPDPDSLGVTLRMNPDGSVVLTN